MSTNLEERAGDFLCTYLDMLHGLGTMKVNRNVHYTKLTDLLTQVQAEARLAALEEAAKICDAKAVYANRSRYGKDEWTQGLLSELENILRDTAVNIRALAQAAAPAKET